MRENIEIADEIVTIGGIIGRIVSIKDDTIVIETAGDRSKIRLARWSIQQNITATERAAQEQAANKENKKVNFPIGNQSASPRISCRTNTGCEVFFMKRKHSGRSSPTPQRATNKENKK